MKCDAKRLDNLEGGFTCSVLGDTVGANWLWERSPYKEKIGQSPECDACIVDKKGLFGSKAQFSCWVMGNFQVKSNLEQLKVKIRDYTRRDWMSVQVPNEQFKAKLIGPSGKNITEFQRETHVELIIDDTPGEVFVKSDNRNDCDLAGRIIKRLTQEEDVSIEKIREYARLYR